MPKVTIKHKFFAYREKGQHPLDPNKEVYRERVAYRGDEVELSQEEAERGKLHGAFRDPSDKTDSGSAAAVNVSGKTDEELVEWIEEEKPTVQEVLDASGGDPDQARRLLAAEESATGGDSRQTLVEGLSKVMESEA